MACIRRDLVVSIALAAAVASCGSTRHHTATHDAVGSGGGGTRVVSVPWRRLSVRQRIVRLSWVGGGCLAPDRIRVVQTHQDVTVTVLARERIPGSGQACPLFAVVHRDRVVLLRPLGPRHLVHAPVTLRRAL